MRHTLFYSWQSDLPNNTNRGFIEEVIEKAVKEIDKSDQYDLELSIDRDTKGVSGSPNISQTIINKISKSDVFIADVSIVTGIVNEKERLSPNPNVLIELGYAIALLGWERIILFANEIYGKKEELPFDIRQHSCIGYSLKQDDAKAATRNGLSKLLSKKIIEITNFNLKKLTSTKEPLLVFRWNYIDVDETFKEPKTGKLVKLNTDVINIKRAESLDDFKQLVERKTEEIQRVDGSIDPDWDSKVKAYIVRLDLFLEKLSDQKVFYDFLISSSKVNSSRVTLMIENIGTSVASDIRVDLELPEWLLSFEKMPDKNDVPVFPIEPKVEIPKVVKPIGDIYSPLTGLKRNLFSSVQSQFSLDTYLPDIPKFNNTHACYLKERNTLHMWADKLLHKHSLHDSDGYVYILPLSSAPLGENVIKGACIA